MPHGQHVLLLQDVLGAALFGFILPNLESLAQDERARYLSVYCGVCHSIKQRYGQLPRLTVSFDLTFMALVLTSLYEPEEHMGEKRCPAHPTKPQKFARSEFTDYAADLSVVLGYFKMLDDWKDDHSAKARVASWALLPAYRKACQRIPEQCALVETALKKIQAMEQQALAQDAAAAQSVADAASCPPASQPSLPPDAPANRFGLLLGDLFACKDDFWATDLRRFGARLGKFVYVMDAAMDLEEDLETGSYNPFKGMDHDPQALRDDLEYLAASMTETFERLPLERDLHVMRSVLYAGIWQRFEAKEKKTHDG